MANDKDKNYSTTETPLAAHLVTEGFSLVDIVFNPENGRASFVFPNDSPKLLVSARDFQLLKARSSNASLLIQNYIHLITRAKRGF